MGCLKNDSGIHADFIADTVELVRTTGVGSGVEAVCRDDGVYRSYVFQCFSTAAVESMIVPSMSNRRPLKVTFCEGAVNDML